MLLIAAQSTRLPSSIDSPYLFLMIMLDLMTGSAYFYKIDLKNNIIKSELRLGDKTISMVKYRFY